jgi:hypothetical protein
VAALDSGAVMPFVASGFGDGEYPVVELLDSSHGSRVGAEITFLRSSTPYPLPR